MMISAALLAIQAAARLLRRVLKKSDVAARRKPAAAAGFMGTKPGARRLRISMWSVHPSRTSVAMVATRMRRKAQKRWSLGAAFAGVCEGIGRLSVLGNGGLMVLSYIKS